MRTPTSAADIAMPATAPPLSGRPVLDATTPVRPVVPAELDAELEEDVPVAPAMVDPDSAAERVVPTELVAEDDDVALEPAALVIIGLDAPVFSLDVMGPPRQLLSGPA